jgi:5-(carboxyamino)imidazole ribonucleotide synthase
VIAPGGTIGILGGGQLGRMTAIAARQLGYHVTVLDPRAWCSARGVVDDVIEAPFTDADAAARLADLADVVTLEIEKVGLEAAEAVLARAPMRPSPGVLARIQDRATQRQWLADNGFPQGEWRVADGIEALAQAARDIGAPCRAKASRGGYDGRGQAPLPTPESAAEAHAILGGAPAVVERELALEAEISVMVARNPSGDIAIYPPAQNWHQSSILDVSSIPAGLPLPVEAAARDLAEKVAVAIGLEGILAVELFVVQGDRLLVNELAPRPHNTFHATALACETDQFEQLVRAVCDLPLGSTRLVQPVALANLLGDLWDDGPPPLERALAMPGVHLWLYDKSPRPHRKVGHLLATGATSAEAVARVRAARALLEKR